MKELEKSNRKEDKLSQGSHEDEGKKGKEDKKKKKKKSKEEKKKSLEGGIKKPLSAYMLYTNHRRPVIKAEH